MTESLTSTKTDLKKLATGTSLAFIGAVLGNGLVYLYGIILSRFLGAEILGLYFLALILMQLANAICRVGLPEGVLRFVAIHTGRGDDARVKGTVLSAVLIASATSLVAAALLFLCAEPVSVHLLRQPNLTSYVKWFALSLPFFSVFILVLNALQALKRMDLVVICRDFLQPVIMFLFSILFFYCIQRSSTSFLIGHLISMIVALAISVYFLNRACPALGEATSAIFEWKLLLAFALPITGSDLAHYLFRWSDTFLLSYFGSPAELGIYNSALRTTLLLNLLAVSVNALYAPIAANHHSQQRQREMQDILTTLIRWCLTLALPLVAVMALLARDILGLWGPEFTDGSTALIVLAISQLIFITSNLLAFTLLMSGKQYLELGNTACVTLLNIAMSIILIPHYGMTGAAISMLVSQVIALSLRLGEVVYILKLQLYTTKYMKPFTAAIGCLVLILPFQQSLGEIIAFVCFEFIPLSMATMFFVFITLYFVILYLLGLEREDLVIWRELQLRAPAVTSGN